MARCFVLAFLLSVLTGCDAKREHLLDGRTMGTTYHIQVVTGAFGSVAGLQNKIDRRLDEINRSMSPYLKDSEISRFNRFSQVGGEFPVSRDFMQVMKAATQIHALSEGAWDGTVNPLVDLGGWVGVGHPGGALGGLGGGGSAGSSPPAGGDRRTARRCRFSEHRDQRLGRPRETSRAGES
jgi:hypothetical protein